MALSISQIKTCGERIFELRKQMTISTFLGDYKAYKKAKISYASETISNYDIAKQVKFPKVSVPLFSKMGFNAIKVAFFELFRRKTPDERKMAKLFEKEKIERNFFNKTV